MEFILLKALLSKDVYSKYSEVIDTSFYKDNNKELYRLYSILYSLQNKELKDYSLDDIAVEFGIEYPVLKADDQVLYNSIFKRLREVEVDPDKIIEYLEKQRHQVISAKIASEAVNVALGKGEVGTVISLARELEAPLVIEEEESPFVSIDAHSLLEKTRGDDGLFFRLKTMNRMLGPLRKGNFGFLFARPEMGKTTFLASEGSFMAEQTTEEHPVLWFNNEEVGEAVGMRILQATLGVTVEEIDDDPDRANELFNEVVGKRFLLWRDKNISKKSIEAACEKYQPCLIILDQIDKILGFEADRDDLMLKKLYQWARTLADRYGAVIGVCQAGGTAENKKWLVMNDVDRSHTAKQGEADWILGIGGVDNPGMEYERYLSLCKNKLPGSSETLPTLRHGRMTVLINPSIARYEDSMKWD